MSTKKRVHELAKEYGLSGQELAAKLKELGFSEISPQSTLDEFAVACAGHAQAYGLVAASGCARAATLPVCPA